MAEPAVSWRLHEKEVRLECGPLVANLALGSLGVSLTALTWQDRNAEKFGAFVTSGPNSKGQRGLEIVERYVRGADLVVTFAKVEPYNVSPQFYWRAKNLESRSAVAIEFIASMQTDLLDSDVAGSVSSFGLDAEVFLASELSAPKFHPVSCPVGASSPAGALVDFKRADSPEPLFVFRNSTLGLSYAEMVHPSDFIAAELLCNDAQPWLLNWTLFPERLEKGVIRRARICGWFLPAENDLEVAVELARRFVNEPPPLTT